MDLNLIESLVEKGAAQGASDIHFVRGIPVKCRLHGKLVDLGDAPLTAEDCEEMAKCIAGKHYDELVETGELDIAKTFAGERCRINVFYQQDSPSMALRILSSHIPKLNVLGLPPVVAKFPTWKNGIVLVTGQTGSGKSTTLAAILDEINHTRYEHIITLEDPIEYIYTPDKCVINQREVGKDTKSYSNGLRAALREDPDIILIGEMRDIDTIETALTAAETGHLVFATLHTNSAASAVDRIVGIFPEARQQQIRLQLSSTLKAVLSQQLLVRRDGNGRVLACETMVVTPAIRNLIFEGKSQQITSMILSTGNIGNNTMDNCIAGLITEGKITKKTAFEGATDPEFLSKKTGIRVPHLESF